MSTAAARELKARRAEQVRPAQHTVIDRQLIATEASAQRARMAAFPTAPRLPALRTAP